MHERSLARALLNQISDIVSGQSLSQVAVIRLSIGRFSGVEPDLFQLALYELIVDTPFRDAQIEINVVDIEAICPECDTRFRVEHFSFTCPICGCQRTRVVQGEELVLDSLVLEKESSCPTTN